MCFATGPQECGRQKWLHEGHNYNVTWTLELLWESVPREVTSKGVATTLGHVGALHTWTLQRQIIAALEHAGCHTPESYDNTCTKPGKPSTTAQTKHNEILTYIAVHNAAIGSNMNLKTRTTAANLRHALPPRPFSAHTDKNKKPSGVGP